MFLPALEMPARRGLGTSSRHFPLTCYLKQQIERVIAMETVRKEIRGLDKADLDIIEQHAQEENIRTNELLMSVIHDYATQIREQQSSETLHAYIDDLIAANNNLVLTTNYNTVVIGEALKIFLDKLEKLVGESDADLKYLSKQLDQMTNRNT